MIRWGSYLLVLILLAAGFTASLPAQTKQDRKAVISRVNDKLTTPLDASKRGSRASFQKTAAKQKGGLATAFLSLEEPIHQA